MKYYLSLRSALIITGILSYNCSFADDKAGEHSLSPVAPIADKAGSAPIKNLRAMNANPSLVSVSGLSSGGYMAMQFGVANSASIMGVGVVAGGAYKCVEPSSNPAWITPVSAAFNCMNMGYITAPELAFMQAKYDSSGGRIDNLENIKNHKIYLFSGGSDKTKPHDETVKKPAVDVVRRFYEQAGVPGYNVLYESSVHAPHAFISPSVQTPCEQQSESFTNHCDSYDQPKEILQHIYGNLKDAATQLSSKPEEFNQMEFSKNENSENFDERGYIYIPETCKKDSSECAVHVVFHGCLQGASNVKVQNAVYEFLGYNRWADTNKIIVLYPQLDSSKEHHSRFDLEYYKNPKGCWDWWGFTGNDFAEKSGKQIAAVNKMLRRLTREKSQ